MDDIGTSPLCADRWNRETVVMATAMAVMLGVPVAQILLRAGTVAALLGVLIMMVGGAIGSAVARIIRADVLVLLAFLLAVGATSQSVARHYARTADPAFTISRSVISQDPRQELARLRGAAGASTAMVARPDPGIAAAISGALASLGRELAPRPAR